MSPEYLDTLKWKELTGVLTVKMKSRCQMKLWDSAKLQDTSPEEFWKHCRTKFRAQLHAMAPSEVSRAVVTLVTYANETVHSAKNVQKQQRPNILNDPYRH